MPADRRISIPTAKPVKSERTHEENQERAYIAASRRSDRSLEARIESARRASEIHKKRTGRALRVTEQDVVNEEMYEEEDDDLPTQYQRLNAHLQTSSWLFNRKLHDYIATQHGVRNMFLHQQFPGQNFPPYGGQFQLNGGQVPMTNQSMLPPQIFNPTAQEYAQPSRSFSQSHQVYRHTPYSIPERQSAHQRSASIPTPHGMTNFNQPMVPATPNPTSPGADAIRRMSLPPHAFDQTLQQDAGIQSLHLSSIKTLNIVSGQRQPTSPHGLIDTSPSSTSGQATPQMKSEHNTPTNYQFSSDSPGTSSQVLDMNPLSMSLPPESQQFVGSALDPNDPRTAILMAGSDNLPQPFMSTYSYNPNPSPKSALRAENAATQIRLTASMSRPGITMTVAPENLLKRKPPPNSADLTSPRLAATENINTPQPLFNTAISFEYSSLFDFRADDNAQSSNESIFNEPFEESPFINWDQ